MEGAFQFGIVDRLQRARQRLQAFGYGVRVTGVGGDLRQGEIIAKPFRSPPKVLIDFCRLGQCVFGTGQILRDFLYVDDCVNALLAVAVEPAAVGEILNVGNDRSSTFLEVAETLREIVPGTEVVFTEFTPERKAQEPGDFVSDIGKIRRLTGWEPRVGLREGLERTVAFYRERRHEYF